MDKEYIEEVIAMSNAGIYVCALRQVNGCDNRNVKNYETTIRGGSFIGKTMRMAICEDCFSGDGWVEVEDG